jgi:hypothetical protein
MAEPNSVPIFLVLFLANALVMAYGTYLFGKHYVR